MSRGTWTTQSGAVDSSELSSTRGDLLKGATAITGDSDGEMIEGTLQLTGSAQAQHVLSPYTFYNTNAKSAVQGQLTIQNVVNFKAAQYSNLTLIASWALPGRGPWSGLRILCKQGGYPSNVNDGTLFYEGSGTSTYKTLSAGVWYFTAWNYITTNTGRLYGSYVQASANNVVVHGQQVFTSSGTFTVPVGVTSVDLFGVGGGSGGHTNWNGNNDGSHPGGGAGGGGYTTTVKGYSVSSGQVLNINIGSGGAGGIAVTSTPFDRLIGKPGGDTTILRNGAVLLTAKGAIVYGNVQFGSDGGSGGGSAYMTGKVLDGGVDGGDGGPNYTNDKYKYTVGKGQHTTTRAFGESSNTLYAGGGGGGTAEYQKRGGIGGSGGGGNGVDTYGQAVSSGSFGTGGGGGGGANYTNGGNGGSGIVIIRW